MTWEIRQGDALERLREMPDESVQTVVTSPPYWGLRDYGDEGQLGLEPTPEQYVANLVEVFREVRRVLRKDGTVWLNLGDSYAAQGGSKEANTYEGKRVSDADWQPARSPTPGLKPKDLVGVPWRVAFALQADWWLRSDIIWSKPNPMPESVTDRPTRAHEYLFLLTKSARYFFDSDAIREEGVSPEQTAHNERYAYEYAAHTERAQRGEGIQPGNNGNQGIHSRPGSGGRNRRSVWEIATAPFPDAHFAVFPPKLVEPCILAGSPPKCCGECGAPWERVTERGELINQRENRGQDAWTEPQGFLRAGRSRAGDVDGGKTLGWRPTCEHPNRSVSGSVVEPTSGNWTSHSWDSAKPSVVLDPFCGSGTTGVVALRHDRSFIGIELSSDYCEMARNRIRDDAPLLNTQLEAA